jgi:hypothetical protein
MTDDEYRLILSAVSIHAILSRKPFVNSGSIANEVVEVVDEVIELLKEKKNENVRTDQ